MEQRSLLIDVLVFALIALGIALSVLAIVVTLQYISTTLDTPPPDCDVNCQPPYYYPFDTTDYFHANGTSYSCKELYLILKDNLTFCDDFKNTNDTIWTEWRKTNAPIGR